MRELPVVVVDAFAEVAFEGNPAAVCILDAWLPDATLQAIAVENNLSETAFLVRGDAQQDGCEAWHLRWFTPGTEVDLCGHATLASAFVLFEAAPQTEALRFHTASGALHVERRGGRIEMDLPAQPGTPAALPPDLARALGGEPRDVVRNHEYWLVRYDTPEEVVALHPDTTQLADSSLGFVPTAAGPGLRGADGPDFVSRMFAPHVGIDEDPVCGSAHCLLTPYWAAETDRTAFVARQVSPRGGTLHCTLEGDRVRLAGHAVKTMEGVLFVP